MMQELRSKVYTIISAELMLRKTKRMLPMQVLRDVISAELMLRKTFKE
jgi:hypothetical protein